MMGAIKCTQWLQKTDELQDQRIIWIKRPVNLGLFKNLNEAIKEVETDWILFFVVMTGFTTCHRNIRTTSTVLARNLA